MAVGQTRSIREGFNSATAKIKQNFFQFALTALLVMACGATNKFFGFPMPWIAGQSRCMNEVQATPDKSYMDGYSAGGKTYTPQTWIETKANCKEKAEVFVFVAEKFTITTAHLVFFGVGKAVFNFATGVLCDAFGRKAAVIIGWCCAIPMPFMVMYASNWWMVATANIFLGIQQALVWSATIFIMIDYLGQENSGIAIGINETIGYTTIAIVNEIAAALLNEEYPRTTNYHVVLGIIFSSIVISALFLRESKQVAVNEEAIRTKRSEEDVATARTTSLIWQSGRDSKIDVARAAFVYTSFINVSLISICFAGLMINFIAAFILSLMKKWLANGQKDVWAPLTTKEIADVVLCYEVLKGTMQWIFGFAGDRGGRKLLVVSGLLMCVLGLVLLGGLGVNQTDPKAGFYISAILIGVGTAMMYTNLLAAVCDHADPSWRASALGAYRFWRDMGFAIGALVTGAVADWIGIPWSIFVTAMLTLLAGILVFFFYEEVDGDDSVRGAEVAEIPEVPVPAMEMKAMKGNSEPITANLVPFQMNPGYFPGSVTAQAGYPFQTQPFGMAPSTGPQHGFMVGQA